MRLATLVFILGLLFATKVSAEIVASPTYTVCRPPGDCISASTAAAACNDLVTHTFNHTMSSSCYPGTYSSAEEYALNGSGQCRIRVIEYATCENPQYISSWTMLGTSVSCPADFTLDGGICVADGDFPDEEDALGLPDEPEDDCSIPD